MKRIACDFDGTLFEDPEPGTYPRIGAPKWNVINALKKEIENGSEIYLYTLRGRKSPR